MKLCNIVSTVVAIVALQAPTACAKYGSHSHNHAHVFDRRHRHHVHESNRSNLGESSVALELRSTVRLGRRGGQCQFPTDAGLVAVTPDQQNAGWAMSPNQPCLPGNYCPYACPPGLMMAQWSPEATSYTYPQSMVRMVLLLLVL